MTPLTTFVLRHRLMVCLAWVGLAAAGVLTVSSTVGRLSKGFATPGTAGYSANQHIKSRFGLDGNEQPSLGVLALGVRGRRARTRQPRMIRILIAEDQPIVRAGFRALLDAEPDMTVVGQAATGLDAVEMTAGERPDVVLMDIRMPELDGLEATRQITGDQGLQATRVLVLTTFELDEYVFAALRGGASGFLLKAGEPADLIHAIRVVAAGEAILAPSVTRRLISAYVAARDSQPTKMPGLELLTPRELEVLELVARGKSNQEISEILFLSPLTAKTHVSRILAKLGLRDRVQLVIAAFNAGIAISPPAA